MAQCSPSEIESWLNGNYRIVSHVVVGDSNVRISVDLESNYYDRDAIIGLIIRKFDCEYVDVKEKSSRGEIFLYFER